MSKGMAVAIFKDIYTQVATEEEKMETGTGAVFRHEFEVMELTDKEIREQIVS